MKTMAFIAVTVMVITSSCASNKNTTSYEADDRYYSLADARREQKKLKKLNAAATEPSQVLDEDRSAQQNNESDNSRVNDYAPAPQSDGETTIINNYYEDDYDMDDYYDYMYASRIRRFNRPYSGFGYYDPFFTNAYWYTYDPFLFGNSIYSSYSFFNPYVPWGWNTWSSPGFSFGWNSWTGWNVGWGWNSWGYNPYSYYNPWRWNSWGYNPYSPFAYNPFFYSPYSYGAGYMNGFNNGFAYGMMMNSMYNNPVYYNSYDQNTYNFGNSVYYGANTGAVGGGSGFSGMSTLSSSLGDKIGTNYQAADGGKVTGTLTGGKPTNAGSASVKPGTGSKPALASDSKPSKNDLQGSAKPGTVSTPIKPSGKPEMVSSPTKPGNAVSGKDQLIQQGVMRPTKADAYSSTPVTQAARPTSDNRPESPLSRPQTPVTREPNIQSPVRNTNAPNAATRPNTPTYNYNGAIRNENQAGRTNAYSPAPVRSDVPSRSNDYVRPSDQTRPTAPSRNDSYTRPSESVRPNYPSRQENNYSRPEQRPSNVTQPSRNTERPSYRDYQSPRREERNYQQRSEPQRENRRQNYQPRDSYQPRNNSSAPRQNYQAPSRSGNSRGESRPQYNSGGRSSGGSYNSGGSSPRMNSGSSGGGSKSSGGSVSPRSNGSRR